jgi:glycosyltransferase involved in cell wall biosynthesis
VLSVSVVTPSLNQGQFIERTVRSVLDQGYPSLEFLVYDGGSTDATLSVLDPYRDRVELVAEPDRGQADAINRGIRATTGDVVGWLNSDDVYAPGALANATAFLADHPDVDVVYGDANLIDANDVVLGRYYTEPWDPGRLIERCYLCQPAVFFRRAVVDRFGPLDERLHYALDYEYWVRLAQGGARFAYLPTLLAASRQHPETKTLSARLAVHAEINTMLRSRIGRVPESWLINNAHTLVELRPPPVLPFAVAVAFEAVRLSLRWNGSISRALLADTARPMLAGAGGRLVQSRSAATRRPAS